MRDINDIMPKVPNMKKDAIQRFVAMIEYDILSGCWLWKGNKANGYGKFKLNSKDLRAHRLAYLYWKGEIPEGLVLDHLCRNPACVNPNHLEPVTIKENLMRGFGACAIHARKTHCIHGHEFTPENTYFDKIGRHCRMCIKDKTRRYRLHQKKLKSKDEAHGWGLKSSS